jgi:hypothetical protein
MQLHQQGHQGDVMLIEQTSDVLSTTISVRHSPTLLWDGNARSSVKFTGLQHAQLQVDLYQLWCGNAM